MLHRRSLRGDTKVTDPTPAAPCARPLDLRFLASHPVRRVAFVDAPPALVGACRATDLEVVHDHADLVLSSRRAAPRAALLRAPTIVALGSARRPLAAAGYDVSTFLVRDGRQGPRLVVPLQPRAAAVEAVLRPMAGRGLVKRLATRLLLAAMRAGLPVGHVLTVGTRRPGMPGLLQAATALGLPPDVIWHLRAGEGDDLQRLVWLCAEPGATEPGWAVKTTRMRDYATPFEGDAAALALMAATPASVRAHAPRFLGLIEVDGFHGSVESAAPGMPLHDLLQGCSASAAIERVRSIAAWAIELAAATTQPPPALGPELDRLRRAVIPAWRRLGVTDDLVASLPSLPAVVQHGDLGLWNIVGDATRFTVIDWESAQPAGLPLWDVAYFLTDALGFLAAPGADDRRKLEAMVALVRGELDTARVLFELLGVAARASGVPLDAVGSVVGLGWLHHGLSARDRAEERAERGAGAPTVTPGLMAALAERWVTDPRLGGVWPAFREGGA